ncbi:hypothetical protein AMTRI_Chr03g142420 [Amborella trichopoda]|uniref:VQ domain-containing protein n=1 Tax=Amborella trichopoda TaxID=13333 RepID=W1PNA6_AMBTC|nr:hypothetical protein AMTR_s00014p00236570 [Amborella trichopoda]
MERGPLGINQGSLKICSDRKPMSSLMKVVRPKVYITDSERFKALVQELTGNGLPPPSHKHQVKKAGPVIDTKDCEGVHDCISLPPLVAFTALQSAQAVQQTVFDDFEFEDIDTAFLDLEQFFLNDGF